MLSLTIIAAQQNKINNHPKDSWILGRGWDQTLWQNTDFPKSKIFMGDVGSGFLGLVIALISIYSSINYPQLFWSWLILLGVFLVDASLTLLIRIFRGKKFYIPHSSHAYQKIARKLNSHA